MFRSGFLSLCLVAAACGAPVEEETIVDDVGVPATKEEAARAVGENKADGRDSCEIRGWYGDGDCDWYCAKPDPDCAPAPFGPEPSGRPTKYPIVLAHGFIVNPGFLGMPGVPEALQQDGHTVVKGDVHPFDAPAVRAAQLARQVDDALRRTGAKKVNIVAHSMGGLDARYLVSTLGYGDRVASVSTIATPHRGSAVTDAALGYLNEDHDAALNAIADLLGLSYTEMAGDSHLRAALESLSERASTAFNRANRNDARVLYQSWAGVSNVHGIANPRDLAACGNVWLSTTTTRDVMDTGLVPLAHFVAHGTELRPNDGMVTVESSKWGTFRGCLPADHADQVGLFDDRGPDRYTGFHHLRFFRNLAFELARKGY